MSNDLIQKNAELGRFLFCERYTLQPVKNALYIAEGQDLKRGAVVDVNGVLVGTNSLMPYAVLETDCDTRAKGAFASVFVKGEFNFDKLFFADGLSKEDLDNIVYNGSGIGLVIKPYSYDSDFLPAIDVKDYVTPEMFGAKGDGVTDDTNAFNAMFDNGNYFIVNGTYKISSVSVPNKDIVLVGEGNILVTENGLEFSSPLKHKVIKGLSFELTQNSTCAIVFSGNASTSVSNTLWLQGISVKANELSNKIGISIDSENEALLDNIALYGCCLKITNSINPSIVNLVCRHSHIGILNANAIQGSGVTACGLKVSNATILGCTIGIKAVEVDSIQVSNSMIDYNDYPVVIVGCESPFFSNCYISSRKGLPCIHACNNNSNAGVYGGNGFTTEPTNYLNISQCTMIQHADGEYSGNIDHSAIEVYGGFDHSLNNIIISLCRKSGIDIRDIVNSVLCGIVIKSAVDGSKALISYKNGVLGDDITNTYRDFKTRLPIFVNLARTDIAAQSFSTSYSGNFVAKASETPTTRTLDTNCSQGISHVIVFANDPSATITYTISGYKVKFNISAHSADTSISFVAYGKTTSQNWT